MRKIMLNFVILFLLSSRIGFCNDLKDEVSKKIALFTVQEERADSFHRLNLDKDSLKDVSRALDEILYSKYSIRQFPDFKVKGLDVYDVCTGIIDKDSTQIISSARCFLVAVTNDFKTFRLTGFEEHNEFSKMADFLLGKTTPIEENILSLSVLSYFMETGLQDIKIVSNSREFKKLMKEWDIQDFEIDKFARKSIADQIKSPSIEKKGDAWEVTFFVLAYKRYVSVREVHINVNDRIFTIVKDEPIS